MMQRQSLPSIVTLTEIEEIISSDSFAIRLIDAIKEGFISYSNGGFNACPIQTMGAPPMAPFSGGNNSSGGGGDGGSNYQAQTCVKSGYVTGASHYVIKVASGGHPFPNNSGLMQLYSQSTGKLETILLDEGILTELRTAAVGAVAAQILAPDILRTENGGGCIGVLGTGIQARYQLQYLAHVITCRNVKVWGRTKKHVQKYIKDMELDGWNVSPVETPQDLLTDCSLIVTTTSSREPLLQLTADYSIKHPLHITCIGSDATGKMELDPKLVANADLLVADCKLVTSERGEFEIALKQKLVSLDSVVELGKLIERKELHRQRNANGEDCRLTIFDSSGVAVQDCVIAAMVNESLVRREEPCE
jgi:ornithine cyclodeaminase